MTDTLGRLPAGPFASFNDLIEAIHALYLDPSGSGDATVAPV